MRHDKCALITFYSVTNVWSWPEIAFLQSNIKKKAAAVSQAHSEHAISQREQQQKNYLHWVQKLLSLSLLSLLSLFCQNWHRFQKWGVVMACHVFFASQLKTDSAYEASQALFQRKSTMEQEFTRGNSMHWVMKWSLLSLLLLNLSNPTKYEEADVKNFTEPWHFAVHQILPYFKSCHNAQY